MMQNKTLVRFAAGVMVLMLAGCATNNGNTGNTAVSDAAEAETEDTGGADTTDTTDAADAADTPQEETFETQEFFELDAYLSAIDVGKYVTLGDYKDLEVTAQKTEVSDDEIAYMIEYYESALIVPEEVTDRALQEGDTAQLDYSGRIKETDEVFDGGTAEGQTLEIGSGTFIDGFESGMVGMEIGETRELELSFPDPYPNNPDLAGVPVIFTVTLNGIQAPGEFTDETVKELGIEGVETTEQFRSYIEQYMRENAEAEMLAEVESVAAGLATENATFTGELPEKMMERYIYMMYRSAYLQAQSQGIETEELINQTLLMEGHEGEAEDYIQERAEGQVKELLVYEAIARAEDLEPSEEELTEGIADVLLQTGFETVEEYEKEQGLLLQEAYRENLVALAVRAFLTEHANVTYVE